MFECVPMLQASRLLPGIVHELRFNSTQAEMHLMDAEASDIFLFLGLKGSDTHLTINTKLGGVWGAEEKLILPPRDHPQHRRVSFKLTERQVEIWNDAAAHAFQRCNAAMAARISFSRLSDVENPLGSLSFRVMTPEAMGIEIGYQVLNHRVARLEKIGRSLVEGLPNPTPTQNEVDAKS